MNEQTERELEEQGGWCCDLVTGKCLALVCIGHLIDVHAVVTCQGASRCQVVGAKKSGDDAVLVHLSDCSAINEINQAILVHCNAC